MEFLKGFSFDIQMFALTGASGLTLIGKNSSSVEVEEHSVSGEVVTYYINNTTGAVGKSDPDAGAPTGCTAIATVTGDGTDGAFAWVAGATTYAADFTAQLATSTAAASSAPAYASVRFRVGTDGAVLTVPAAANTVTNTNGVVSLGAAQTITVVSGALTVGGAYATDVTATGASVVYNTGLNLSTGIAVTTDGGAITVTDSTNPTTATISVTEAAACTTTSTTATFAAAATGYATVNNIKYFDGTAGGGFTVTSTATSSYLSTGNVVIDNTGTANHTTSANIMDAVSGTVKSVTVGGTTGSSAVIAAGGDVTFLTNGAALTAEYTATVDTVDTLAYSDTAADRGSVTINNVKFEAGGAAGALTFHTENNGTPALTNGTIYLSQGTSRKVADNAGTPNIQDVTANNGDITVTASSSTNLTIGDLDNGDSFTIGTKTFSVIDGELWNVTDAVNLSTTSGVSISSGEVTTRVLTLTLSTFSTDPTYNAMAKAANTNQSVGTAITEKDVKNIAFSVASSDTGMVNRTVTQFASRDYLHKDGTVGSDRTNAIGQFTYNSTSNVVSYTPVDSTKAQRITLTTPSTYLFNITGTNAADTIVSAAGAHTINGGNGNDTITAANDNIVLGGAGDDSLVATGATGVSLNGGAGKDTLIGNAAGDTTITGGDGADLFVLSDSTGAAHGGVFTDYKFGEDLVQINVAKTAIQARTGLTFSTGGVVTDTANAASATVNATSGFFAAEFQNATTATDKQMVAWAGENSAKIDASSMKSGVVLIGDNNSDVGDQLIGSSKDDTIYAGDYDSVLGGDGTNIITLGGTANTTQTVFYDGKGKNTVNGFEIGFDSETKDKIMLSGVNSLTSSLVAASATLADVTLKSGTSNLVLNNVTTSTNGVAEVLVGDNKAVFAADGATISASSGSYADFYYGTKNTGGVGSTIDFSTAEGEVNVDLSKDSVYKNIAQVVGGQAKTTLMGSKANETLVAGIGETSLYGGAGKDSLVGNSAAKDTFFMLAGAGNDSISGFTFFNGENADTADVVNMSAISSAKLVAGGVQLNVNDTDKILIEGATADSAIGYQVNGGTVATAKVGSVGASNSFTYLKGVNYYGGGTKVDTLSFASGDSDNHEVWLGDPSKGVTYNSVDVVDGSSAAGNLILAGDSAKNTIIGGTGNNSLWGGAGDAADTLRGGSSANVFFYGKGEGNDVIEAGSDSDVVNLYNIALSDVKSGEITSSAVNVEFQDGSKLTVNTGYRDVKFNLASGESYTANHNTGKWE